MGRLKACLNTAEAVDNVIFKTWQQTSQAWCLNTAEAVDNVIDSAIETVEKKEVSIPPKQ